MSTDRTTLRARLLKDRIREEIATARAWRTNTHPNPLYRYAWTPRLGAERATAALNRAAALRAALLSL